MSQAESSRRHYERNREARIAETAARRQALRDTLKELKESDPCMDCGVSYPHYVMDYDHRPGEVKRFNPAALPNTGSLKTLLEEIAKCDLVCSNCHRIRTHERNLVVG